MSPSQYILSLLAAFSLLKSSQQFHKQANCKTKTQGLQRSCFHAVYSTSEWTKLSKNTVLIFLRNNLRTLLFRWKWIVTTWMQGSNTCQKKSALSHSRQNAAWRNFINCNAKLALSWRSWQLGKQRNIPVWNANTTDLKIFETINTGHSNVILKLIFRELIQEQSMLE